MSTELIIQEVKLSEQCKVTTLTTVAELGNDDLIDTLLDRARYNSWCLEGECGAEFELTGDVLNVYIGEIRKSNPNLEFFDDDMVYRCSLSF